MSWLEAGWEGSVDREKPACPASIPQSRQCTLCALVFIMCKIGMVAPVFHFILATLDEKPNIYFTSTWDRGKLFCLGKLLLGLQISSFGVGICKAIIYLLLRPEQ